VPAGAVMIVLVSSESSPNREVPVPLIQINMLEGRTAEQKKALLGAVTDAVHTSIGAPLASIRVWIHEFAAEEYMADGVWQPDKVATPPAP
jgi:4-oxalocrotonate tautomerase